MIDWLAGVTQSDARPELAAAACACLPWIDTAARSVS